VIIPCSHGSGKKMTFRKHVHYLRLSGKIGVKMLLYKGGQMLKLKEKVEKVIGQVRPLLQRDGGDVELVSVDDDGVVKVRLRGACAG